MIFANKFRLVYLTLAILIVLSSCSYPEFDSKTMRAHAKKLQESHAFHYPLNNYFPEIPVTDKAPPKGESYHAAEDCFVPAGTPVYAIGDGTISYSGHAHGYGGLIIIDHPDQNVYSLYGHLSLRRWKKESGQVKRGEQIGHIGDAEECYTMLPHIHFGIRMGEKGDYPGWPWMEKRWMAGYTHSSPEQFGWFRPSEIIGQTDSMRTWHSYISKREVLKTGLSKKFSDFKITSGKYNEKENLDQMIREEFGDLYRLADWNDILAFNTNIEEWADSVGLVEGEENSLLICNEGYRIWLGRQYYISRFNHKKPDHFLAFDSMHDNFICLGSWYGLKRHALAVRK